MPTAKKNKIYKVDIQKTYIYIHCQKTHIGGQQPEDLHISGQLHKDLYIGVDSQKTYIHVYTGGWVPVELYIGVGQSEDLYN